MFCYILDDHTVEVRPLTGMLQHQRLLVWPTALLHASPHSLLHEHGCGSAGMFLRGHGAKFLLQVALGRVEGS